MPVRIFKSHFHCVQEIYQKYIIKSSLSFRFYTLICIDINLINSTIKDSITVMGVMDVTRITRHLRKSARQN